MAFISRYLQQHSQKTYSPLDAQAEVDTTEVEVEVEDEKAILQIAIQQGSPKLKTFVDFIEWSVTLLLQNNHLHEDQAEQLKTVALRNFHEAKEMKSKPTSKPFDVIDISKACQKIKEEYKFELRPLTHSHDHKRLFEATFVSGENSDYGDKCVTLGQVILVDTPTQ
ncbi:hypothetical protein SOPP22_00385 [Shewanella sp. OPT22]|nr:hypothetical protein SOPP22_00385 [Shewanella sp. OPT22]